MKKALIIAQDFPPLNSIGAQRPYSWYRYFPENNIYPIIFAKKWNSHNSDSIKVNKHSEIHLIKCEMVFRNNVSKIPFLGIWIRKFLTFFEHILKWKTLKIDHTNSLYWSAHKYLKNNDVDIIIATGEPWILFKYADTLSKEFKIPWIADYRDGWNTNVSLEYNRLAKILSKLYFKKIEKKIINSASAFSFSDPCESLKIKNINSEKKIITTINGYNNDIINQLEEPVFSSEYLNISYAGTIYDFQDFESFLNGLNKYIDTNLGVKIKVNLYGSKGNIKILNRISTVNPELINYFNLSPRMTQEEVIIKLNNSHVLLLLASKKHVALPAKLFEYFGLEKMIIVSTNDKSDVETFVNATNSGFVCDNSDEIYECIAELYDKFKANSNFKTKIKNKEFYSRKHQAILMCEEINKII